MTAVAVLQETAVREQFSTGGIYWLTVGADAIGEKLKQLQGVFHKALTGKVTSSEDAMAKSSQEWREMFVLALVEKKRVLMVLDDPWMPEQVRFLNPIDSSHAEHRLLVTTRIRDLVRHFQTHIIAG